MIASVISLSTFQEINAKFRFSLLFDLVKLNLKFYEIAVV